MPTIVNQRTKRLAKQMRDWSIIFDHLDGLYEHLGKVYGYNSTVLAKLRTLTENKRKELMKELFL